MRMNSKSSQTRTQSSDAMSKVLDGLTSTAGALSGDAVDYRGIATEHTVNKHERGQAVSGGSIPGSWNPMHPEIGLDKLIPSVISMDRIVLRKAPYLSSTDIAQQLRNMGDTVETFPFKHYRANTYVGQPRLLNNTDCIRGKEPIYGTFDNFQKVLRDVKLLQSKMLRAYEDSPSLVAKCEMEDLPKLCMQQWKQPGWYAEMPVTKAKVPKLTDRQRSVLKRVARAYKRRLPKEYDTQDWRSLSLQDYDPDDTMTGAPTFASGEQTYQARLANLKAAPLPNCDPEEYMTRLLALQANIGWPDPCMYSPVLSTRFGPRAKPIRIFYGSDGYMESFYEAVGAYNRVRFVYPAPYLVNYLLSPLYVQLSNVRKNIPGLWHDPDSQANYISILQRQGHLPYAVDFSGMDTAMFPEIIDAIIDALEEAGFSKWTCQFMRIIYKRMGIIFPSLEGGVENVTLITGPVRPWCSGFKLTSEFDTIYGLSVILDALDQIRPGTLEAWENGSWTIAELGDDIIFTLSSEIDVDRLAQIALESWGATLKVNRDLMFLKWILPLNGEVKEKARTFARTMQQTFFNEDRYSGVEGGDRPPAVLRMALKARTIGLKNHPDYEKWMPELIAIMRRLPFVGEGGDDYINEVLLGEKLAIDRDLADIYAYAKKQPSYYLGLAERAKYEPSAAQMLRLWQELKVPIDNTPALEIRKIFDAALFSQPTNADISALMQYTNSALS